MIQFIDRYGNIITVLKERKWFKVLMDGHMDTVPGQEENGRKCFWWRNKDGKNLWKRDF